MPEHAEIRLMADYINQKTAGLIFSKVVKNPINKQIFNSKILPKEFTIEALARGKELQIIHYPTLSGSPGIKTVIPLTITMGMSGNFIFKQIGDLESKWPMLIWYTKSEHKIDSDRLELIDHRRFAKWKFRDWNSDRGPDIVWEQKEFRENILQNIAENNKKFRKPLCELLMDQKYFNGIGNYLLAEILGKLNVNPFQSILDLSTKEINKLFNLCYQVPLEAYLLGGGQLKDWKNQNNVNATSFKDWLKFYQHKNSNSVVTNTGRNFWYNKKWEKYSTYEK